jgi:hypothetical protein
VRLRSIWTAPPGNLSKGATCGFDVVAENNAGGGFHPKPPSDPTKRRLRLFARQLHLAVGLDRLPDALLMRLPSASARSAPGRRFALERVAQPAGPPRIDYLSFPGLDRMDNLVKADR